MTFCWTIWFGEGWERISESEDGFDYVSASESHYNDHESYIVNGAYPLRSQRAYWLFGRICVIVNLVACWLGWGFWFTHPLAYTRRETVMQLAAILAAMASCINYAACRRIEANGYVKAGGYANLDYFALDERFLRPWAPPLLACAPCALFIAAVLIHLLTANGRVPAWEVWVFNEGSVCSRLQWTAQLASILWAFVFVDDWHMHADKDHCRMKQRVGIEALRLHQTV